VHVRTPSPRGLVFATPLIGGSAGQQVRDLKGLIRQRYDLFTFAFSGHGDNATPFSLRATVQDTTALLSVAMATPLAREASAGGIAACFGAIPLLKALDLLDEPLDRVVLINALPRLLKGQTVKSFWSHHRRQASSEWWHPSRVRASLIDFIDRLFPSVSKTPGRFGALTRQRVGMMDTVLDLLTYDPLDRLRLHRTDVLCLYARHDPLLTMFWDLRAGGSYETAWEGVCRRIRFVSVEGDHYLSSPTVKATVLGMVHGFLSGGDPKSRCLPSPVAGSA
jgi:hypothetical protein